MSSLRLLFPNDAVAIVHMTIKPLNFERCTVKIIQQSVPVCLLITEMLAKTLHQWLCHFHGCTTLCLDLQ